MEHITHILNEISIGIFVVGFGARLIKEGYLAILYHYATAKHSHGHR